MDRLHRFTKEASFTAGAKAVSLFFIVGVGLLLGGPRHRDGRRAQQRLGFGFALGHITVRRLE
jgi:hypothetical protein